jgi:polyhydroxybutyrate depolymerase
MEFKGLTRTYGLYVPSSYTGTKAAPLLILLHGGGSDGRNMVRFTGFNRIADDEGLIVVTPDGVDRHWNDGRVTTGYRAHEQKVDDVGFIAALIDSLSKEHKIDERRIYVAGISNGGMMSYRLGLELPDKIAAIAPVVAAIPEPLTGEKWRDVPVPAVIVNGTEDPLVPWDGGEVKVLRKTAGRVLSVPDSVAYWTRHNHLDIKPRVSQVPDYDPSDGMRVIKSEYPGVSSNQDVVFYAVEGGGHTWHGPRPFVQYLPPARIGRACKDFDATEAIWQFFSKHPLSRNRDSSKE